MKANPIFSIVIATYNRAHIVERAIRSVTNQQCKDFELIVVDDGSTDSTAIVVEPYLSDPRIIYYIQPNQGVSVARNKGASLAKGKYVLFLDSDDELKPGYFDVIQARLHHDTEAVFVSVDFYIGGKFSIIVRANFPYGKYSTEGLFLAGSFVVRLNLFTEAGGYDSLMAYGENTELAIRLGPLLKKKIFIEESLLKVYQEKETRTSNSLQNVITSTEYILKKHTDYYKTNPNPKWMYHNVLAVGYVKSNNIEKARAHLVKAMKTYPWRIRSYLRYSVISIPFLRRRIYGA